MDEGLWHFTGGSDQDRPQEKEMQKGKMVVWGGITNSWEEKLKAKKKSISCKEGHNKGQKRYGGNRAEDIKKRWQEYTEELYKKI